MVIGALGTVSRGLIREQENLETQDDLTPANIQHC